MTKPTQPRGAWRAASLTLAAVGLVILAAGCQSMHRAKVARGPVIQAPAACGDFTVAIYFESQSAAITPQADRLIGAATRRARGCEITGINVIGLADSPGDPHANLALSKERADAVTRVLHSRGFTNVAFQVVAAGDVGAQTAAGQARPLRRRADVQFHLAPGTSPARR